MRPKGEPSSAQLDREWPHNVALPSDRARPNFDTIHGAATQIGAAPLSWHFRRDDADFVGVPLRDGEDAAEFQRRFDGETVKPRSRRHR